MRRTSLRVTSKEMVRFRLRAITGTRKMGSILGVFYLVYRGEWSWRYPMDGGTREVGGAWSGWAWAGGWKS